MTDKAEEIEMSLEINGEQSTHDHVDEEDNNDDDDDEGDDDERQLNKKTGRNQYAHLPTSSSSTTIDAVNPQGNRLWQKLKVLFGDGDKAGISAPHLSFHKLFLIFFLFGCRAFGGPVAQISMMKQQLVLEEKWLTVEKFNRVLAVYQVLPGPEATELACYFGLLSRGRLGAVIAGLAFLLPGFSLLLLASWLYVTFGLHNPYVLASFQGAKPVIAALIFRATYKLGEHAFEDQDSKQFSMLLGFYGLLSFVMTVLRINFFLTLGLCGVLHLLLIKKSLWKNLVAGIWLAIGLAGYIIFVYYRGMPSDINLGNGFTLTASLGGLFTLGLLAGLLTFGGAYTAIPFVYANAVVSAAYITEDAFWDTIAITNVVPTPLVMFVTMVGFIGEQSTGGSGFLGATLMTFGIFLPAFSFTLIGHGLFEKVVDSKLIAPFLDGVTASVIGIVLVTAFQFARLAITLPLEGVVFLLAFAAAFHFKHKYTQPLLVFVSAFAAQILFLNE